MCKHMGVCVSSVFWILWFLICDFPWHNEMHQNYLIQYSIERLRSVCLHTSCHVNSLCVVLWGMGHGHGWETPGRRRSPWCHPVRWHLLWWAEVCHGVRWPDRKGEIEKRRERERERETVLKMGSSAWECIPLCATAKTMKILMACMNMEGDGILMTMA